ncbi:MAG: hypothetical protein QG557_898, partial [Pseudomonadota bacterium]|nr:hypothetical protein [Pseudomonadota bacterium]
PVAQLDRVIGYEPIGREFESLRAHQYSKVYSPVAQSVEQMTVNHWVGGSSPSGGANKEKALHCRAFLLLKILLLITELLTNKKSIFQTVERIECKYHNKESLLSDQDGFRHRRFGKGGNHRDLCEQWLR